MKTRTWPVFGVALGVLLVFVRGVQPTAEALAGQFLFGLAVGLPIAYVFRRFYPDRIDPVRGVQALPYVALYLLAFLREVVVANFDLAYRALAPGPPLHPEVIYVPLRVETDLGITSIANTITLTPGTVALDYDEERNAIYVHVIDERDLADVVAAIREWEDYALVALDEQGRPDDEAGDVIVTGGEESGD